MTFDTAKHPRGNGGRFVPVASAEPETVILAQDETTAGPVYTSGSKWNPFEERLRIDDRTEILDRSKTGWRGPDSRVHHQWLIVDGTPVAMLHYRFHPSEHPYGLAVCDIEVRPDQRGRGYGARAIEIARSRHGNVEMYTTGEFSQTGAAAFADHLPLLPGGQVYVSKHEYTFVRDWDDMEPEFPLS